MKLDAFASSARFIDVNSRTDVMSGRTRIVEGRSGIIERRSGIVERRTGDTPARRNVECTRRIESWSRTGMVMRDTGVGRRR